LGLISESGELRKAAEEVERTATMIIEESL
jgi:hypothetical protein